MSSCPSHPRPPGSLWHLPEEEKPRLRGRRAGGVGGAQPRRATLVLRPPRTPPAVGIEHTFRLGHHRSLSPSTADGLRQEGPEQVGRPPWNC